MLREVELTGYLPPFLQEFKELKAAFDAENPEFQLAWDATENVLKNEFISTADEYGISLWEQILKILPDTSKTLEERRGGVKLRLMNTGKISCQMIAEIVSNYTGSPTFCIYKNGVVKIEVDGEIFDEENLLNTLKKRIPAHLKLATTIHTKRAGRALTEISGGIFCYTRTRSQLIE